MEKNEKTCRCEHCFYKSRRYRNRGVSCGHPDQKRINQYFEDHDIKKAPGFIGYAKTDGTLSIKRTPKWCPLEDQK